MRPEEVAAVRKLEALHHALGEAVLGALAEPRVVEVLANPDGRLVVDSLGEGRRDTGVRLSAPARERVIRLVAEHVGEPVTRDDPRLSGVLPSGERFQGFLPPISAQPTFSIRKRPAVIWTLADYVDQGVMSAAQADVLRDAVVSRRNILISGGTGSGKTTLANALLAEPAFAGDRVFLLEDTPELQCSAWDLVSVLTRRYPKPIGVVDLVRDALRMRPDRIVVGEMRDGAAALETLKAWNTGHPGGLSTLHANSAAEALDRLEDLLLEVAVHPPRRAIAQAIDLIVQIRRTREGRRIEGLVTLDGLTTDGAYRLAEVDDGGCKGATSAISSDPPAAAGRSRISTPSPKQHTSPTGLA
jgi:type IV secretion system protein VirB11